MSHCAFPVTDRVSVVCQLRSRQRTEEVEKIVVVLSCGGFTLSRETPADRDGLFIVDISFGEVAQRSCI